MNNREFSVHGSFSFSIEGQLLHVKAVGPGNTEAVIQYMKQVQAYREQLSNAPWVSLVVSEGVPLLPPEATAMMVETIRQAKGINLVATAVVLEQIEYKIAVQRFWEDIYQRADLPHGFFETVDEARNWLLEQL